MGYEIKDNVFPLCYRHWDKETLFFQHCQNKCKILSLTLKMMDAFAEGWTQAIQICIAVFAHVSLSSFQSTWKNPEFLLRGAACQINTISVNQSRMNSEWNVLNQQYNVLLIGFVNQ